MNPIKITSEVVRIELSTKHKIESEIEKYGVDDIHFMLDIETLGTEKDGYAPIVSIALVPFSDEVIFKELAIYSRMDMNQYDNLSVKPQVSMSTILWWMSQSDDAREEFKKGDSELLAVLENVKAVIAFWESKVSGKAFLWAKSPNFDVTLCERWLRGLTNNYDNTLIKYSSHRCVRTSNADARHKAMSPSTFERHFPMGTDIVKHNAFFDSVIQIEQVQYGWNHGY